MTEPNYEAAQKELSERSIYGNRPTWFDLQAIIDAMRTPVAQEKECKHDPRIYGASGTMCIKCGVIFEQKCEHVWADYVFSKTLRCRKCNVPKPTDVKPSETLYSKIMEELKQPKDLTLGKSDIHAIVERARYTAERHYEPIIAAAKEEGRKEGIKQVYERIKPIFIGKETI